MIHMFTLYICLTTTQRSCQHCHKIDTWTSREISNNDIILFIIRKIIINLSISRWDINNRENCALEKYDANLPIVGVLCQFENGRPFHLFAAMNYRPTTCIERLHKVVATQSMHIKLLEIAYWKPNRLQALFLCRK